MPTSLCILQTILDVSTHGYKENSHNLMNSSNLKVDVNYYFNLSPI